MADELDPSAIAETLRSYLTGREPRTDLVDVLGGWSAIENMARILANDPLLRPTVMLLARAIAQGRDSGAGSEASVDALRPAAEALAAAVTDTTDPGLFADITDMICSNADLADLIGDQLAAACINLAAPPRVNAQTPGEAEELRHAVALETSVRLALAGHGTRHDVLAALAKVREPQPLRYARAISRTVAVAYDHWNAAEGVDDVADVLDILTGVTPPKRATPASREGAAAFAAADDALRRDITSDAAWAKANVDVARALRADLPSDTVTSLGTALESLAYVGPVDDRPDAVLLKSSLELVRGCLQSLIASSGTGTRQGADEWAVALDDVQAIVARTSPLLADTYGLGHWSGDRKTAVLNAWARFVADIGTLRDALDRDSIYNVATVLDDVLAIYVSTNSYDIIAPGRGIENVVRVIRPAIAKGFAARSGLLRNLGDHTEALRKRVAAAHAGVDLVDLDDLMARLVTAETVLATAKASLEAAAAGPPGKQLGQAPELPALLAAFLGLDADAHASLADIDHTHLKVLNAALADRLAATDLDPDPVLNAVRTHVMAKLSASPDFTGEVAAGVTQVLDQLIRFIASRQNVQASWRPYLFKSDAKEADLHVDLYDWLKGGHLSSATNVEAQQIGGGRIDLMVTFPGFHLYIELKEDATQVPLEEKVAYLEQTIAYQATGIRIGFLVMLRSKSAKGVSVQPHLRELVTHTTIAPTPGALERHVVMLELPGDRTSPSK